MNIYIALPKILNTLGQKGLEMFCEDKSWRMRDVEEYLRWERMGMLNDIWD